MRYWFFWLGLVGTKSVIILSTMLVGAIFVLWLQENIKPATGRPGALKIRPVAEINTSTVPDLYSALNLILLSVGFAVVPLGNYSIVISGMHPGLINFNVLQVTSPALGLLLFPCAGGMYFLLRLAFNRGCVDCPVLPDSRSRSVQLSGGFLMAVAVVGVLFLSTGLEIGEIVKFQAKSSWGIFTQPVGALLYLVGFYVLQPSFVDLTNFSRAGISRERTGASIFLANLSRATFVFLISLLFVHFFLGGWLVPFGVLSDSALSARVPLLLLAWKFFWLAAKVGLVIYLMLKVNKRQPRLKKGQLIRGVWNFFIPVGVVNVLLTVYLRNFVSGLGATWVSLQAFWTLSLLVLFRLKELNSLKSQTVRYINGE